MLRQFIEKNYPKLLQTAKNTTYGNPEYQDMLNECLLYLLERDCYDELIQSGNMEKYINTMVRLSAFSPTSQYQHKYNKIKIFNFIFEEINWEEIPDDEPSPDLMNWVEECVKDFNVTEKIVFEARFNTGLPTLCKRTGVNSFYVYKIYNECKSKIIDYCNQKIK